MKQNTMIPWYQKADVTHMLLHKSFLKGGSIAKEHNVNLKNFNPLDGQILGVFNKKRKDGGKNVHILEMKRNWRQIQQTSKDFNLWHKSITSQICCSNCYRWQYLDHRSATYISHYHRLSLSLKFV